MQKLTSLASRLPHTITLSMVAILLTNASYIFDTPSVPALAGGFVALAIAVYATAVLRTLLLGLKTNARTFGYATTVLSVMIILSAVACLYETGAHSVLATLLSVSQIIFAIAVALTSLLQRPSSRSPTTSA